MDMIKRTKPAIILILLLATATSCVTASSYRQDDHVSAGYWAFGLGMDIGFPTGLAALAGVIYADTKPPDETAVIGLLFGLGLATLDAVLAGFKEAGKGAETEGEVSAPSAEVEPTAFPPAASYQVSASDRLLLDVP